MTNANLVAAYRKCYAANDRYNRAVNRLNWLNCHRGPDAFMVHADALAEIQAEAKKAQAEWEALALPLNLSAAECVAVIQAAA
jgi:hypothetical protein